MMSLIGIPIGFYGYIFPGNINLMIVELYSLKKYKFLSICIFLIIVFETFYCVASLLLLNSLNNNPTIYKSIEYVSFFMILFMGFWMIFESQKKTSKTNKNTIYRGLISVVFHPQQIPFWVIMGVIVNKQIHFDTDRLILVYFAFFNAFGTLLAMFIYMIFGLKLLNYLKLNFSQLNKIIGIFYVLFSIYSLLSIN